MYNEGPIKYKGREIMRYHYPAKQDQLKLAHEHDDIVCLGTLENSHSIWKMCTL